MKHLREFVYSILEYRRTNKENFKHKLEDILMFVILDRLSKCIPKAIIIQFSKHNLKRLQSIGILLCGPPLEAMLCRVFQGIDDEEMTIRVYAFANIFRKEIPRWSKNIIYVDGRAMRETIYTYRRNSDIILAYSLGPKLTATDVCKE